jgi:uncharacterized protein
MRITRIVWKDYFVDKLATKHRVSILEAEDVLLSNPYIRKIGKGNVKGEDVYGAYGQSEEGRYLIIIYIRKTNGSALPISARDMDASERKYYDRQR